MYVDIHGFACMFHIPLWIRKATDFHCDHEISNAIEWQVGAGSLHVFHASNEHVFQNLHFVLYFNLEFYIELLNYKR